MLYIIPIIGWLGRKCVCTLLAIYCISQNYICFNVSPFPLLYSHWDHTGANEELKTKGVQVVGPVQEKAKIPGIDHAVGAGDTVAFGSTSCHVMDVGGHTKGHIAFYLSLIHI